MDALMESIISEGLHQPIIIRKVCGVIGFDILAGHSRVEAMRRLEKQDITAIVKNDIDDDQAWDWLKRVWIAWGIINAIGAFIAYIRPLFTGLNTITE